MPETFRLHSWERQKYRFADFSARQVTDLLKSGDVYTDEPGLEAYLNAVLSRVIPEELKEDSLIHVYIVADGQYNARMAPSGTMFMNIGLIAESEDESYLAAIMAHELAHYYLQHSLLGFIKQQAGDFKDGLLDNNADKQFSIRNEYHSDSLAMVWLRDAGYSLDGMLSAYQDMVRIEHNNLKRIEDEWEFEQTTHPLSDHRLEKLQKFSKLQKQGEGKKFLVSHLAFNNLIKSTKVEALKQLLYSFQYPPCIEKAFKFHLLEPNNSEYIYYLMEAIRRRCYMDATKWHKNFVTDRYYVSRDVDDWKVKDKMTDHLFVNFHPDLLMLSEAEVQQMKTNFYWEEPPKFRTYEQAFIFYYRVGRVLQNNEVILSNALSILQDTSRMHELLKEYLSKEDVKHPDYARNLLNANMYGALANDKLSLLNGFTLVIKQGDEEVYVSQDQREIQKYVNEIRSKYPGQRILTRDSLQSIGSELFHTLLELQHFSRINTLSVGNKPELHILEPRWWEAMRQLKVNEVQFFNYLYVESRKRELGKDAYEEVINSAYSDILSQQKRPRNFYVLITSIRDKWDDHMKYIYVKNYDLKYKEPGDLQISSYFANSFSEGIQFQDSYSYLEWKSFKKLLYSIYRYY